MDFDALFTNMPFTFEKFIADVKENHVDAQKTGQKRIDVDMIITADWYPPLRPWNSNLLRGVWISLSPRSDPPKSDSSLLPTLPYLIILFSLHSLSQSYSLASFPNTFIAATATPA